VAGTNETTGVVHAAVARSMDIEDWVGEFFGYGLVKQPAFAKDPRFVEMCLDDAAEISSKPFEELLLKSPGKNKPLWARQLLALKLLERLKPEAVEKLQSKLLQHPSADIRRWFQDKAAQATFDLITADRGGYELLRIPGGEFMMGSPVTEKNRYEEEGPQHKVQIQDFCMGRYPVTNEEYGRFMKEESDIPEPEFWADRKFNQPRQPVVGVSWKDAQRYAKWAGLRLPTEAEWEYACRAGTDTRYYTGDKEKDLDRAGWYREISDEQTHPVGEKEPNTIGLYDMHGNVFEWVEDDWHGSYNSAPEDGSAWIDEPRGAYRVIRGGGWLSGAQFCRSATRIYVPPGVRRRVGFRLASSVTLDP